MEPGTPGEVRVAVLPGLDGDAVGPRGAAPAMPASPAADAARAALGQAVHRCLEWLTRLPLDEARQAGTVARAVGTAAREFALDRAAAQDVQATVTRVLHSPPLEPLLDARGLIYADNEVGVSHEGGLLRIDRLVCRMAQGRRQWWVLDYKLHHAPDQLAGYREQLARYARAVQALQPHDEVVAAFVTAQGELVVPED
jgi:ATP-dependent helicase/nuclease subunit A